MLRRAIGRSISIVVVSSGAATTKMISNTSIKLLELFKTFAPHVQFIALDMVEGADRVAVRWQLHANHQGEQIDLTSMAIYRFEEGRIAEDWGIPIRGQW
jgi:predicted ester cyclase